MNLPWLIMKFHNLVHATLQYQTSHHSEKLNHILVIWRSEGRTVRKTDISISNDRFKDSEHYNNHFKLLFIPSRYCYNWYFLIKYVIGSTSSRLVKKQRQGYNHHFSTMNRKCDRGHICCSLHYCSIYYTAIEFFRQG